MSIKIDSNARGCNVTSFIVFTLALFAATGSTLSAKLLLDTRAVDISGHLFKFSYPILLTFATYLGEVFVLVCHWLLTTFQVPFPTYDYSRPAAKLPWRMYLLFLIPTLFDYCSMSFTFMGLQYINASFAQILSGSTTIFVALINQFVFHRQLKRFQWLGITLSTAAVCLAGIAAMCSRDSSSSTADSSNPVLGIILTLTGCIARGMFYVTEERILGKDVPPLLLVGVEGLWGSFVSLFLVFPVLSWLPGSDHGSYMSWSNMTAMLAAEPMLQALFLCNVLSSGIGALFCILVTSTLSSVWRVFLKVYTTPTIWAAGLLIYYSISTQYGEAWGQYSFLQVLGVLVLIAGTAVYNAPHRGSLRLTGGWRSLYFDFRKEYEAIQLVNAIQDESHVALMSSSSPQKV